MNIDMKWMNLIDVIGVLIDEWIRILKLISQEY